MNEPGTDRRHPAASRSEPLHRGDQLRVDGPADQLVAAGHDCGIGEFDGIDARRHREARSDRCLHVGAVDGRHHQPVGRAEAVRLGEDLGGSRDVEQLHAVEYDDDNDVVGGHDTTVCRFLWERWQIGHGSYSGCEPTLGS